MTSTLYWEPVKSPPRTTFSTEFKLLLRERFNFPVDLEFSADQIEWLNGVAAGTTSERIQEDVSTLIQAIRKHGKICVYEGNW